MGRHRVDTERYGNGWRAFCSCRTAGPVSPSRALAADWELAHLKTVERAKAHLRGTPTLASTYDYYREMEADPAVPEKDRVHWKVLADGLEHRLGIISQDVSMFEESQ